EFELWRNRHAESEAVVHDCVAAWKNRAELDVVLRVRVVRRVVDRVVRVVPQAGANRWSVADIRQYIFGAEVHLVAVRDLDAAYSRRRHLQADVVLLQPRIHHAVVVGAEGPVVSRQVAHSDSKYVRRSEIARPGDRRVGRNRVDLGKAKRHTLPEDDTDA